MAPAPKRKGSPLAKPDPKQRCLTEVWGPGEQGPSGGTRSKSETNPPRKVASPIDGRSNDNSQESVNEKNDRGNGKQPEKGGDRNRKSTPKQRKPVEDIHAGKPEPSGQPPVWANVRPALCNACLYLNQHSSSITSCNKIIKGIMMDAVGYRDVIDGQVVIYAAGGGKEMDADTKKMVLKKSQDPEKLATFQCLLKTKENDTAFVVGIGSKNPLLSSRPPAEFMVMAHFRVTDTWVECVTGPDGQRLTICKARFEKVKLNGPSWWMPAGMECNQSHGANVCEKRLCDKCQVESKHIFTAGWTCLNHKCEKFFQFPGDVNIDELKYNETFLQERAPPPSQHMLDSLEPIIPELPTSTDGSTGTEEVFKRGVVCPKCHCCSRRIHWSGWICENKSCDFTYTVEFREHSLNEVKRESERLMASKKGKPFVDDIIKTSEWSMTGYCAHTYYMPDEDGTIIGAVTILKATPEICAKPGGPDDIFRKLQTEKDLGLKRFAARNANCRNEELMSHFGINYGAFYKYGIVSVDTRSFMDAPETIKRGLAQMIWARNQILATKQPNDDGLQFDEESMPSVSADPNELLFLSYMERSTIGWHDDGEKELDANVGTLSSGSPSMMMFRPKNKNTIGKFKGKSALEKEKVLAFPVLHGDIIVMHGTKIHQLYDHSVIPEGKLRFAMTARHVILDRITDEKVRKESEEASRLPHDIESLAYKGIDLQVENSMGIVQDAPAIHNMQPVSASPAESESSAVSDSPASQTSEDTEVTEVKKDVSIDQAVRDALSSNKTEVEDAELMLLLRAQEAIMAKLKSASAEQKAAIMKAAEGFTEDIIRACHNESGA